MNSFDIFLNLKFVVFEKINKHLLLFIALWAQIYEENLIYVVIKKYQKYY